MPHLRKLVAACLACTLLVTTVLGSHYPLLFPADKKYSGFSDVSSNSWYAPYVSVACKTGLMNGKSVKIYDPDALVTSAELATVMARLHNILKGGDGTLPSVPTTSGTVAITDSAGTPLKDLTLQTSTGWVQGAGVIYLGFSQDTLNKVHTPPSITLHMNGRQYRGDFRIIDGGVLSYDEQWRGYMLDVDNDDLYEDLVFQATFGVGSTYEFMADQWYINTAWYAMFNDAIFYPLTIYANNPNSSVTRAVLADTIAGLIPASLLTPLNKVTSLPDSTNANALLLYNAGILMGVDDAGTFSPRGTVTRSQLATVLARIVQPDLRVSTTE